MSIWNAYWWKKKKMTLQSGYTSAWILQQPVKILTRSHDTNIYSNIPIQKLKNETATSTATASRHWSLIPTDEHKWNCVRTWPPTSACVAWMDRSPCALADSKVIEAVVIQHGRRDEATHALNARKTLLEVLGAWVSEWARKASCGGAGSATNTSKIRTKMDCNAWNTPKYF